MAIGDGVYTGNKNLRYVQKKTASRLQRSNPPSQNKVLLLNPQREKSVLIRRKDRKVNKFSRRRTNENKKQPKTTVNDAGNMI